MKNIKQFYAIFFIVLLSSFVMTNISFAQTHIPSGDVSGIWTIDDSPYIIDGFVTVPIDSTLIIEPSVFVIFSTNNGLQIEGRLISEGTENDSIIFTVQDTSNNTGLGFYHTDITNQDSSKITYSIFEHVAVCFDKSSNILFSKSRVSNHVGWSGVYFDENSCPTLIDIIISNNSNLDYYGGGIYCTDSSNPSLVNVTIIENNPGGIWCNDNSNPTLENVTITDNIGAGICCTYSSSPILSNVTISGNEGGGLACCDDSNPTLDNVIISNNSVWGGLFCTNSSPILTNVVISGNQSTESGGGIYCQGYEEDSCNPILNNVTITGNEAYNWGGGIYTDLSNLIVVNSLIADNTTSEYGGGGGIGCFYSSTIALANVTITGNNAYLGGGIQTEFDSNIHLENCILWNDTPEEVFIANGSYVSANYCDIEGGAAGTGNINTDPLFANTLYHILEDSPCIDAGNPDTMYYDVEDPNNPGFALYPAMGTILNDMGAYGGHGNYEPPVSVDDELILNQNLIQLNNYPNPFTNSTTISFNIYRKDAKTAKIEIFNIKGEKIRLIKCKKQVPIIWDGKDENGNQLFTGIYLYKLSIGNNKSIIKKMVLLR